MIDRCNLDKNAAEIGGNIDGSNNAEDEEEVPSRKICSYSNSDSYSTEQHYVWLALNIYK